MLASDEAPELAHDEDLALAIAPRQAVAKLHMRPQPVCAHAHDVVEHQLLPLLRLAPCQVVKLHRLRTLRLLVRKHDRSCGSLTAKLSHAAPSYLSFGDLILLIHIPPVFGHEKQTF